MIIFLDGILMKFHINNYKKICNSCKNYLSIMWYIIILKKSKESFLLFSHSLYNPFSEIFNFQLVSLFKDFSFSLRKPQKYTRGIQARSDANGFSLNFSFSILSSLVSLSILTIVLSNPT